MAKAKVRYKGFSDVREFKRKDLAQHGVAVDRDLVFSRQNAFAMNIDLNDELEAILRNEGTFTISEIKDDDQIGGDIVKATVHDDTATADKAVDGNTGQEETNKAKGKGKK